MTAQAPHLVVIRALEEALHRPEIRRSRAAVDALLADDFIEIGASGRTYRRGETIDHLAESGSDAPLSFEADDYVLTPLAPQVVLLTYRSRSTKRDGSARHVLRSSIWVGTGLTWRLRFHQGTLAASPG